MNLIQAFVRNVGTCRCDVKGKPEEEVPSRVIVPMRSTGAEQLVVVKKAL